MNLFQVIEQLYTNRSCKWINDLEEAEIEPFVIQKFLSMNDNLRTFCRWLDKYTFNLPPRMWLSLAWSVLPKYPKMPFIRYTKKVEEDESFNFILKEVRKQFQLSDNDYKHNKHRILEAIKSDMTNWFIYYGIHKGKWKEYQLDFAEMKKQEVKPIKQPLGLGAWGM